MKPRHLFLEICVVGRCVEIAFVIIKVVKDSNHTVNLPIIGREQISLVVSDRAYPENPLIFIL